MSVKLKSVTIGGFQSYWEPQTIEFEPDLTLIAGRNDVGKSALFRALRLFTDSAEGARDDFKMTLRWDVPSATLAAIRPDITGEGHPGWLQRRPSQTVSGTWVLRQAPDPNHPNPRGNVYPNELALAELRLDDLDVLADGQPGTQLGWQGGPFGGSATLVSEFSDLIKAFATEIAYLAPRRIQPGPRGALASPVLTPTGDNLTEVVFYLQTNEPKGGFAALEAFLHEAFPQLVGVTARVGGDNQNMTELHVLYEGAVDRLIPLSQCGTGIEQMLALAVSVLRNSDRPRVFLIDEPQAYLHPHAERSLQSFLSAHPEHQYVIATHSAVFLNAHPLKKTRLITMAQGHTEVAHSVAVAGVLDELGLTAGDLWLAEHVLWVEGRSDAEIFGHVIKSEVESALGVHVREMPFASQFASNSQRTADATFSFLRTVVQAIAPLPVSMLFVLDDDEKSDGLKAQITEASADRARFLGVREVENLLLDARAIHQVLDERAELFAIDRPDADEVAAALRDELSKHDDEQLYPSGFDDGDEEEAKVVGSELLNRVWWQFLNTEYRKVGDGAALTSAVLRTAPDRLQPIRDYAAELTRA